MKASELITELSAAISKHGDIPVVVFCDRADEYIQISYSEDVEEIYQGEDMEMHESMVVRIVA